MTVVDLASSISVTKSADPATVPETGGNVTFTIIVGNTSAADSVTIEAVVDDIFGDVSASCDRPLPHVLAPQTTLTCTFTEFVSGPAAGDHRNVVTVTGTDDDGTPITGDDDAIVDFTPVIDLEVTAVFDPEFVRLDFDPAVGAAELTELTVTVTNTGPSDATGVVSMITLPDGVTYESHSGTVALPGPGAGATTTTYDPATGELVIGDLPVGATVTLVITVSVDEVGLHVAEHEVIAADQPDVDSTPGDGRGDDYADTPVEAVQILPTGEVGDFVWRDDDGDGLQDAGEPGIPGVTVTLTIVATGETRTTTTSPTGMYIFTGLPPGDFAVAVSAVAGYTATTPMKVGVALGAAESRRDVDIGFRAVEVLPATGMDAEQLLWVGLAMVGLGSMALVVARRREEGEEVARDAGTEASPGS